MPSFSAKKHHLLKHLHRNLFEGNFWKESRRVFVERGEEPPSTPEEKESLPEQLETVDEPITNKEGFDRALGNLKLYYEDTIQKLSDRKIGPDEIGRIKKSPLYKNFPPKLKLQVDFAEEQINVKVNTVDSIGVSHPKFEEHLQKIWPNHQKNVQREIDKLETEQGLAGISNQRYSEIRDILASLEREKKDKEGWLEDQREMQRRLPKHVYSTAVDPSIFDNIKDNFEQARFARLDQIQIYLEGELDSLRDSLGELEGKKWIPQQKIDDTKAKIDSLSKKLHYIHELDTENLSAIEQMIRNDAKTLELEAGILEDIAENYDERKAETVEALQGAIVATEGLTDEKMAAIIDIYSASPEQHQNPATYQRTMDALAAFADGESRQRKIQEWQEEIASTEEISIYELSELRARALPLESMIQKFEELKDADVNAIESEKAERFRNATTARETIKAIQDEKPKNIDELRAILDQKLGEGKVKWLDSDTFKNYTTPDGKTRDLSEYTKAGMVFYERGTDFEIYINQNDPILNSNFGMFLQGVEHELQHAVFENDESTKDFFIEQLKNTGKWSKIYNAFIEMVNEPPPESPPTEAGWTTESVASEIFAMYSYTGLKLISPRPGTENPGPKSVHFNNLIWSIRRGNNAVKRNRFEEETNAEFEAKLRGFKAGALAESTEEAEAATGETAEATGSPTQAASSAPDAQNTYKTPQEYTTDLESIKDRIKKANTENSRYSGGLGPKLNDIENFAKTTEKYNNAFHKDSNNGLLGIYIDERVERMKRGLDECEENLTNLARNSEQGGVTRTIKWISLEGVAEAFKQGAEYMERRRKSSAKSQAGSLMALAAPGTGLAGHGENLIQQEEEAEVSEWNKGYEAKDIWELENDLAKLSRKRKPDRFRFKSLLRTLAKKGGWRLRDENAWRILNNLQNSVHLGPELLGDTETLRARYKKAIDVIFDEDEFLSLEKSQNGAYDTKMNEQNHVYDTMYRQLNNMLHSMVEKKRNGENIDAATYEGMLRYCIEFGKGDARSIAYFFIVGIAEGILEPDRHTNVNKKSGKLPILDWLAQVPPTREAFIEITKEFPNALAAGNIQGPRGYDFINYYSTVIGNSEATRSRTAASCAEGTWDHDLGIGILPFANAREIIAHLKGKGGKTDTRSTTTPNAIAGTLAVWECHADSIMQGNVGLENDLIRSLATMTAVEGVGTGTYDEKGVYTRYDKLDEPPREAGHTFHPSWTTRKHLNKMQEFMDSLDGTFYFTLRNPNLTPKQKYNTVVPHLKGRYPSTIGILNGCRNLDAVYNNIDAITRAMVNDMGSSFFRGKIRDKILVPGLGGANSGDYSRRRAAA